jgi:predicted HicB family RNase H-like nuclease
MMNQMTINGATAVINYDPEINLFRGEFTGLNGGADFYAADIEGLRHEGEISLKVFMDACAEDGVEPFRQFSGRFVVRTSPNIHALATDAAKASGKSLNQWVEEAIRQVGGLG